MREARLAQLVARGSHNPKVAGSIPALSSEGGACSVMAITRDSESLNPGSNPGRPSHGSVV